MLSKYTFLAPNLIRVSGEGADYAHLITVWVLFRTSILQQLFRAIYRKSTLNPRYYIAPLDIGLIVHQIYKFIEVASLFKKGPYLEQKTTTALKHIPHDCTFFSQHLLLAVSIFYACSQPIRIYLSATTNPFLQQLVYFCRNYQKYEVQMQFDTQICYFATSRKCNF